MSSETGKPAIPQVPTNVNPFSLTPEQLRSKIKNDQQYAVATNPIEQNKTYQNPEIKRSMIFIPSPVQEPSQTGMIALYDFLSSLKENIEIANGIRGNPLDRFVSFRDLNDLDTLSAQTLVGSITSSGSSTGDSTNPDPCTGFSVTNYAFYNLLAFTLPSDSDLSHVEIYCSEDSEARAASHSVGTVAGNPGDTVEWRHNGISLRHSYNYWIRAVDFSGNRSTWNPNDTVGSQIAAWVKGTINELLDKVMDEDYYHSTYEVIADAFMIKQPLAALTAWSTGTNYNMFDIRKHDGSGTMKGYKCIHTHTSGASTEPGTGADWEDEWEEITAGDLASINVFTMGIIDSNPALGIRGDMIVDGTIIARHIDSGSIEADHIIADAITASHINGGAFGDLTITSGTITLQTSDGLSIEGGGNIYVAPGSDITMDAQTGSWDSNTAEIKFVIGYGGGEYLHFGSDYDSDALCFYSDTNSTGNFMIGYLDCDYNVSPPVPNPTEKKIKNFWASVEKTILLSSTGSATADHGILQCSNNGISAYSGYGASGDYTCTIDTNSQSSFQQIDIYADHNNTYPASIKLYATSATQYIEIEGESFTPTRDISTKNGGSSYNWDGVYTNKIYYGSTEKFDLTTASEVKTSQNIISTSTNTLGKSGTYWPAAYITNAYITNFGKHLLPSVDNTYDIGNSSYQVHNLYMRNYLYGYSGTPYLGFTSSTRMWATADIDPDSPGGSSLGDSTNYWLNGYIYNLYYNGITTFPDIFDDISILKSFNSKKDKDGKDIISEVGTPILDISSVPSWLTSRAEIAEIIKVVSGIELTIQDIEDISLGNKDKISFIIADRDGLQGKKQGESFEITKEWIDDHTFINGGRINSLLIGATRQQDDAIIDDFEQFNALIENLTSRITQLEKEQTPS